MDEQFPRRRRGSQFCAASSAVSTPVCLADGRPDSERTRGSRHCCAGWSWT